MVPAPCTRMMRVARTWAAWCAGAAKRSPGIAPATARASRPSPAWSSTVLRANRLHLASWTPRTVTRHDRCARLRWPGLARSRSQQAERKGGIRRQYPGGADPVLEAGAEPPGNDVIVDDVGQRRDSRRTRDPSRQPCLFRTHGFVAGRPEQRAGVVHGIAGRRVLQRGTIDVSCTRIPEPLAGGIGAGGRGAAAGAAEAGHHEGAQHARHAARSQDADGEAGLAHARLRVLVLGGGLVGGALCDALALRGHRLVLATRSGAPRVGIDGLALDFNALPGSDALAGALSGVDVLVNTVGIFRATAQQSFDAVHVKGPQALFE